MLKDERGIYPSFNVAGQPSLVLHPVYPLSVEPRNSRDYGR